MYCNTPQGLPSAPPALNTTGYCEITENFTSIRVSGIRTTDHNEEKIIEFNVETYDPEEYLALADPWEETPSPCTIPPPPTEPATNTSTSPTISTMETITANTTITTETSTNATTNTTTTIDVTDPTYSTETIDINTPEELQQNNTTNSNATNTEVKEYVLYGVLCTIVLVQFLVIVLLVVKLYCRKRREKTVEDGEIHAEEEQMSQLSCSDREDKESAITDTKTNVETTVMGDLWGKRSKGGGATGTDQHRETTRRISQLSSDKINGTVFTNSASRDHEEAAAIDLSGEAKKGAALVTAQQEQEDSQQGSNLAKVTVTTKEGTHSTEPKETDGSTCSIESKER